MSPRWSWRPPASRRASCAKALRAGAAHAAAARGVRRDRVLPWGIAGVALCWPHRTVLRTDSGLNELQRHMMRLRRREEEATVLMAVGPQVAQRPLQQMLESLRATDSVEVTTGAREFELCALIDGVDFAAAVIEERIAEAGDLDSVSSAGPASRATASRSPSCASARWPPHLPARTVQPPGRRPLDRHGRIRRSPRSCKPRSDSDREGIHGWSGGRTGCRIQREAAG